MHNTGKFIISLDFELMWGVFDSRTVDSYKENILGARTVIPQLLELFSKYEVACTWATVGFLFFDNKTELIGNFPQNLPQYTQPKYNVYEYAQNLDDSSLNSQLHFALPIIKKIQGYPKQEIATHTSSHFYCLEDGPSLQSFEDDILLAKKTAERNGITLESIVFPRNQFSQQHIDICCKHGIRHYRGNPDHSIYKPRKKNDQGLLLRIFRVLDSYINISGHKCAAAVPVNEQKGIDVTGSDFFRPYSRKLSILEPFKVRRIKKSMLFAAKNNLMYHLWWHPHNFGVNQTQNLYNLEEILRYYQQLRKQYAFESITMSQYKTIPHNS